jgi:hypothetical protein
LAIVNIAPDHGIAVEGPPEWRNPVLGQRTFIVGFLEGKPQIATSCKVVQEERMGSTKFGYDCSAFPGMSGSAVWTRGTEEDKGVKLSGIHLGAGASGANEALVFSTEIVGFIESHHGAQETKEEQLGSSSKETTERQEVGAPVPPFESDTPQVPQVSVSVQPNNGPCDKDAVCGSFSSAIRALCVKYSTPDGKEICERKCRWNASFFERLAQKLPRGSDPYSGERCSQGSW